MGYVVYTLNYGNGGLFEEERPFHSIDELTSMLSEDFSLALKEIYQATEVYADRVCIDGQLNVISDLFDRGA